MDFGDAGAPYPTTLAEDGARHTPTGPALGAHRDWESDGTPSWGADADDTTGTPDDEDGVTLGVLPVSTTAATTASLDIDLQNADAVANYLDAWIDFNGDGDWDDSGERIFTGYSLGTSNGIQTLTFTVPQDTGGNIAHGMTFARFRLSTAGGLAFGGPADDGEVEDYLVAVGSDVEDFETGDFSRFPWAHSGDANWTITGADRHAGTFGARSGIITDEQTSTLEVTFDTDDVNLSFWRKVSSEFDYDFLYFYVDGVVRGSWSGEQDWEQFTYPVMAGSHTFTWTYEKDDVVSEGVDAAWIDDVALSPLGRYDLDFGDAAASYPTTLAEDGARHTPTGPTLGAYRDWESDGTHSWRADADDTAGTVDDEDGVTLSGVSASTTAPTMASLEVELRNADPTANYLDAWIDFNGDGDWDDSGEQIFTSHNLGTTDGIQTLSFTVPRDTGDNIVSGVTFARFRVSTAGGLSFDGAADDGEVEDHRVAVSWFGPPEVLNTNAPLDTGRDHVPQIAADGAGNWVAVWESSDSLGGSIGTDTDILVARSADAGATWTVSAPLNAHAAFDSGDDIAPQITTDGLGNWVAAWFSDETQDGTSDFGYDILASRSTDAGATWSDPTSLNTNVGGNAATEAGLKLAADQAGNWVAVWNTTDSLGGTIGSDADILVARSTDVGATWTDPAPLNTNAGSDSETESTPQDYNPQITTDGSGNWVTVWTSYSSLGGSIGSDADILVSRSADAGATWTDPAPLNGAAVDSGADYYPQISVDGMGNWVCVWISTDSLGGTLDTDGNVLVSRSVDSGETWTAPAPIDANAGSDPGFGTEVDITNDGAGNWVVVWQCRDNLGGTIGTDSDLVVSHSIDGGGSWSSAVPLNSNADSDSGYDTTAVVATDGSGNWVTVWRTTDSLGGTIGTDWDIVISRSTDVGTTWSTLAPLNSNAGTDTGHDYSPQLTTDGAGNWVAVWTSYDSLGGTIGTDRDILVSRSTDAGRTWTVAAPLATNAESDSGYDDSPQVTTDGANNWIAVWESNDSLGETIGADSDVLVSRSTDAGLTWTAPTALNGNAESDSGHDDSPQVTTDGANNWIAVWESSDSLGETIGADWDVLVSRSTDAGLTWTAPTALDSNAESDSGHDDSPQVTTDGANNWIAVWESSDSLGETIGADWDILVSRSTDAGLTWTAPTALNGNAESDSGNDYSPQVTTDGANNWIALWESSDSLSETTGYDIDIIMARSTDAGESWSDPTPLNSNAGSDSEDDYVPQVTTDGVGNWVAVWAAEDGLEETEECFEVFVCRSVDAGVTWTLAAPLSLNVGSDFEYDWNPQLTTDGAGNWVAVWDSTDSQGGTIGEDDDILFARFSEFLWDYGDAPTPYPTLLADVGARHLATGPTLGTNRDTESDGQPTSAANGDDVGGALPDDEDGLVDPAGDLHLLVGQTPTVDVTVTNNSGSAATLYGWIDCNGDGVFDNATERASIAVSDGSSGTTVTLVFPAVPWVSPAVTDTYARFRLSTDTAAANATGAASDGEVEDYTVQITYATIADRHVFYDGSYFDGGNDNNAVATDKEALLPGGTATLANYISYARFRGGAWAATLNGVMIDIAEPAGTVTAADFEFNFGNSNTPGGWVAATAPASVTVHEDEGTGGSDRVKVIWADTAISNSRWLQVTVLANANTGLATPDVFYFGLAAGECGNSTTYTYVDATDFAGARDNPHNFLNRAAVNDHYDYNRDSYVDASDLAIVRDNNTNFITDLNLIVVPAAPTAPGDAYFGLPPIDPYVGVDDPTPEDEYESQYEYDEPYQPALEEPDPWESAGLEAQLANAIWAYEMEDAWPDSEADDPIGEAAADDIFAMYYGE